MQRRFEAEQLSERVKELRTEADGHKKAVRYHRRRLKECLSLAEQYERQLSKFGIKLEIQKPKL